MMFGLSFGNGLTVVHFEQQAPRLFAASDNLECRYVRAYLKQQDVSVAQYIQPNLSHLYDTAEDINVLGNETVAFHITAANYRLSKKVTQCLKEFDPSTKVIWFGEPLTTNLALVQEVLEQTEVDACVTSDPEYTLHRMLQEMIEDWPGLEGVVTRRLDQQPMAEGNAEVLEVATELRDLSYVLDRLPSPWEGAPGTRQQQPVVLKWMDRQGNPTQHIQGIRAHSPDRVKHDLSLALRAIKATQPKPTIKLQGFELSASCPEEQAALLPILQEQMSQVDYEVLYPIQAWNHTTLRKLTQAGISKVELLVPMDLSQGEHPSEDTELEMKAWLEQDVRRRISITLLAANVQPEADNSAGTALLLRRWTEQGLVTCRDVKAEPTANLPQAISQWVKEELRTEPEAALLNGFLAYKTGSYPQQVMGTGVKHIGFVDTPWPHSTGSSLGEYSGLNSALIFENNLVNTSDNSDKTYYTDQDGPWKQENPIFQQLSEQAEEAGYYLSNLNQFQRVSEVEYHLQMNDYLHSEPVKLRQLGYSQAAVEESTHGTTPSEDVRFQFLEIRTEEDLAAFLQDVEVFSQTGAFQYGFEIHSYLVDTCRWSGANQCRAKQLPRFYVDEQDQISSCMGCKPIGRLGDTLDNLLTETAVISDQEQLLRGCSTCEIKDTCSKCTFLPAYMNRQQYCDMRKKHTMLHRYMQGIQLFKGLMKYTKALKGVEVQDLRLSLPSCRQLLPETAANPNSSNRSGVSENVFLFFVKDTPMIYQAATQKMLKLNEPMALILEGLMAGLEEQQLIQVLVDQYGLQAEYAASSIRTAEDLFIREGCYQQTVKAS